MSSQLSPQFPPDTPHRTGIQGIDDGCETGTAHFDQNTVASTSYSARLPLLRPRHRDGPVRGSGGEIAGVAAGLAAHLGTKPRLMRLLFLLSTPFGLGPLLYLWFWVFVPRGNPWNAVPCQVGTSRLATPNTPVTVKSAKVTAITPMILLAIGLLILSVIAWSYGPDLLLRSRPVFAIVLVLLGVGLIWGSTTQHEDSIELSRILLMGIPGALLILFGVMVGMSGTISWSDAIKGGVLTIIVLAVLSLVMLPLWARFLRSYKDSLSERTRQTVRADMAAHLHDSVLQTLALIRARADNPVEVAKLARAEERHLRAWLYTDRAQTSQSLVEVIKNVAAEIEDLYGAVIDLVSVGDAVPGTWSDSLVEATREALTNAVKHGAPPYSLYLETSSDKVECFVRDRGRGFVLEEIGVDRHGVRRSIIERLERHGGHASIKSNHNGTEVQMEVTRHERD